MFSAAAVSRGRGAAIAKASAMACRWRALLLKRAVVRRSSRFTVHGIVATIVMGRGLPVLDRQLATLADARY